MSSVVAKKNVQPKPQPRAAHQPAAEIQPPIELTVSNRDFESICDAIENPPPPNPYLEEIAALYQQSKQPNQFSRNDHSPDCPS